MKEVMVRSGRMSVKTWSVDMDINGVVRRP